MAVEGATPAEPTYRLSRRSCAECGRSWDRDGTRGFDPNRPFVVSSLRGGTCRRSPLICVRETTLWEAWIDPSMIEQEHGPTRSQNALNALTAPGPIFQQPIADL
jgi:hypothetical protein